jgi:hypothetical protein
LCRRAPGRAADLRTGGDDYILGGNQRAVHHGPITARSRRTGQELALEELFVKMFCCTIDCFSMGVLLWFFSR